MSAAVAAAVVLVGCSSTAAVSTTTPQPGGSSSTPAAATTTAKPAGDEIKQANLQTISIKDVVANADVALNDGKATLGSTKYSQAAPLAYADANNDGHLDAITQLDVATSTGTTSYLYLWLWDHDAQRPVQVGDVVGRYGACSDALTSVVAGVGGGFTIAESIRDPYDGAMCSGAAQHKVTRTVIVSNGGLVSRAPFLSYGGVCYPSFRDPIGDGVKYRVYTNPSAKAPVAATDQTVLFRSQSVYLDRTWPAGWVQVALYTPQQQAAGQGYGVCGFIKLS